jgi:zinc protease
MLDRTVAPSFSRSTQFELIHPDKITVRSGLQIFSISGGNQKVIKIELLFRAGRWFEKNWGAAYFSAQLLTKGTKSKSSFEIAQLLDHYGAHVDISPGMDMVSISLYTLTKHLQPTLSLLYELLEEANFPEKEIRQLKSVYLQNLQVNNEKTSFLASKLIRKNLYGDKYPYGKELDENDVEALTRDMLTNHVRDHYRDLTIIVAGDIPAEALSLIEKTFAPYSYALAKMPSHSSETVKPFRQIQEKEGSLQSSLRAAREMVERTHADYPAVLLLSHILGGYFGSRLMKNIREEKGLTYGIYASLHTQLHRRYMVIGADVNKENLDLTFDEIRKELKRLREERIDSEELDIARNHFIGSLQSEMTTPFAHAEKLKTTLIFSLPDDYYQRLILKIDALTAEELMETAGRYFNEQTFFEVAVG